VEEGDDPYVRNRSQFVRHYDNERHLDQVKRPLYLVAIEL